MTTERTNTGHCYCGHEYARHSGGACTEDDCACVIFSRAPEGPMFRGGTVADTSRKDSGRITQNIIFLRGYHAGIEAAAKRLELLSFNAALSKAVRTALYRAASMLRALPDQEEAS